MALGASRFIEQPLATLHLGIVQASPRRWRQMRQVEVQVTQLQGIELRRTATDRLATVLLHRRAVLFRVQRRSNPQVAVQGAGNLLTQVRLVRFEAEAPGLKALALDAPHLVDAAFHAIRFRRVGQRLQGAGLDGFEQAQAEHR
ncbi:hypothetical protein D3C77_51930 [compost metagenome]